MAFNPDQPRDKNGRFSSVGAYISERGFEMNTELRAGYDDADDIQQLDKIIENQATQYDGELYRGMDNEFVTYLEGETGIEFEPGNDYTDQLNDFEFNDPAFASTTTDKNLAEDFATRGDGMGVVMNIKTRVPSLDVSDVMGDDVNWQSERILPRGNDFVIKGARVVDDGFMPTLVLDVDVYNG